MSFIGSSPYPAGRRFVTRSSILRGARYLEFSLSKKKSLSGMAAKIDLSRILGASSKETEAFHEKCFYDFELEKKKDQLLLKSDKKLKDAIANGTKATVSVQLTNIDRAFGTMIGAEITRAHHEGLEEDTITIQCNGAGGQSFGAFIPAGLTLNHHFYVLLYQEDIHIL